jgi:hypothetical protein
VNLYSHLEGSWLWTVGVSCIMYIAGDNSITGCSDVSGQIP